ncbi:MAG: inner membrane CreD family protein [Acidobacteriota bacterium]
MLKRLIAIAFIYLCTTVAWAVLGSTVLFRTTSQDNKLKGEVGQLWGSKQVQRAPIVYYETQREVETKKIEGDKVVSNIERQCVRTPVPLRSSDIHVNLSLQHRRKGLLWYSTYTVKFVGRYILANDTSQEREFIFDYAFPAKGAVYDGFQLAVGGQPMDKLDLASGDMRRAIRLTPGQQEQVEVRYQSQGMDQWWYDFGSSVTQVKDFLLVMQTDFDQIDFPQNSIAPVERSRLNQGWELKWRYSNLLTGVQIGMELPHRLNPGPWVSQVTFSAPVALFLFFFLLFILSSLKEIRIHPMNYFFLGAAFFSFHLLLAYLVDHVSIGAAFAMGSAVSIGLVVSYMRLVTDSRFAYREIAISQFVYLVLFSYSFFFEGYTGLAITMLCVVTLFVVMQLTGKMDWDMTFSKQRKTT